MPPWYRFTLLPAASTIVDLDADLPGAVRWGAVEVIRPPSVRAATTRDGIAR